MEFRKRRSANFARQLHSAAAARLGTRTYTSLYCVPVFSFISLPDFLIPFTNSFSVPHYFVFSTSLNGTTLIFEAIARRWRTHGRLVPPVAKNKIRGKNIFHLPAFRSEFPSLLRDQSSSIVCFFPVSLLPNSYPIHRSIR